ncbi:MAG: hypothetical protein J7498_15945 [Sphingobium sp.]|nr:hypothetical protein [Sphingobium sp.]
MANFTKKSVAVTALAAILVASAMSPGIAKAPATSKAARADGIPRARDGHPDFSGIWQTLSEADYDLEPHAGRRDAPPSPGVIEGGRIPYLPAALARRQANFERRTTDDPRLRCFALSVPRGVYYQAPFEILQRPSSLTLVHQFGNQVRDIHTDGSLHPDDPDPQLWLGDSRGHWEGDTLVVDIIGFNEDTWLDRAGNYHSDKLHVVERWKFRDANTILYSATLDDPKVYSRPWTINIQLNRREPGLKLIEDYCFTLEYADHYPHRDGQQ